MDQFLLKIIPPIGEEDTFRHFTTLLSIMRVLTVLSILCFIICSVYYWYSKKMFELNDGRKLIRYKSFLRWLHNSNFIAALYCNFYFVLIIFLTIIYLIISFFGW